MIESIHHNCDTCAHGLEHADQACFNCAKVTIDRPTEFMNWTPVENDDPAPAALTPPPNLVIDFSAFTLRDYFAGMVIASIRLNPNSVNWSAHNMAHGAYEQADAMLEARNK